jgi:hypothetical protein
MKMLLKRSVKVVQCPKYKRLIFVGEINVPKTEIRCRECPDFARETCGYVKCNAA